MIMYRYVDTEFAQSLDLHEYFVLKETPCGVWVIPNYIDGAYSDSDESLKKYKKFVNLSAKKKFCHSTKKDALFSYIKRKEAQLCILDDQIKKAERFYNISTTKYKKEYMGKINNEIKK